MNTPESSARDRLRQFFVANVGRIMRTQELREVAGISEYARRIRELRDEEGMQIRTHKERVDLRSDEYVLESLECLPVANPKLSDPMKRAALLRDGAQCRFCGARWSPGSARVRLRIDYMTPLEYGGLDQTDNVGVICASCAKTRQRVSQQGQTASDLLTLIRRAAPSVQREVYRALKRSFEDRPKP